jgi:hypothetical protein
MRLFRNAVDCLETGSNSVDIKSLVQYINHYFKYFEKQKLRRIISKIGGQVIDMSFLGKLPASGRGSRRILDDLYR